MELPIPKEVKEIWDVWNLRGCILLSLSLQIFLMLLASFRKKCRSKLLLVFIWSAYLLADWIAAVAIGIITKSQVDSCDSKGNKDLFAFWASFLLVHLGGPDTITSFALEDNEFWLRHLVGLVVQVLAAAYCFYLTLMQNKLLVPTLLVLVVGTVKFGERTWALYLASLDHFGETVLPDPVAGPDYEETVAIHSTMRSREVPTTQVVVQIGPNVGNGYKHPKFTVEGNLEESLDDMQLLQEAYYLFESFKGLIVGFLLSSKDRELSRDFFLKRTYTGAFKLIEYELSFMYEVLHTKVIVVRHKIGYTLRLLSFSSTIVALVFFISVEKREFDKFDIDLTHALFGGAIFLDTISVLRLIFSDWTLIALNNNTNKWSRKFADVILKGGRWSGSVSQYNMIKNCLDERPEWVFTIAGYLGFRGILGRIKVEYYSSSEAVTEELKYFIFKHLRIKSLRANNRRAAMEACSQRGDWALLQTSKLRETQMEPWGISICRKSYNDGPSLGNWHIVFQDTCAEAKGFFRKHSISDHKKACDMITGVETKFRSAAVKGSKSKSVLFDACILAKQLQELEADPWTLLTRVWIELLSYAAIKCRPIVHAQQPSKGGELLTFTWLLMNHLGLGTQFYELENQSATKRVPVK
ncbi:hypothetical protein M0R45_013074 [Rubus argutus]|uniref:DUF4220 domain-containing protein n=1 Tax=Rubus argutus TaxID=59490 RepID=A0AAW1XK34_RUBAR